MRRNDNRGGDRDRRGGDRGDRGDRGGDRGDRGNSDWRRAPQNERGGGEIRRSDRPAGQEGGNWRSAGSNAGPRDQEIKRREKSPVKGIFRLLKIKYLQFKLNKMNLYFLASADQDGWTDVRRK